MSLLSSRFTMFLVVASFCFVFGVGDGIINRNKPQLLEIPPMITPKALESTTATIPLLKKTETPLKTTQTVTSEKNKNTKITKPIDLMVTSSETLTTCSINSSTCSTPIGDGPTPTTLTGSAITNATKPINGTLQYTNRTTLAMNATNVTSGPTINVAPTTPMPSIVKEIKRSVNMKTCSCNLERNICDINCCCDPDCSFEDKLVFDTCYKEQDRYYDTNFCQFTEYIYQNNTPYEWEVNQNGLFCIVRTNLPKTFLLQKKQRIDSIEDAKLQLKNKYSWSSVAPEEKPANYSSVSGDLKYGTQVWIFQNGSDLRELVIPDSFITIACLSKKNIHYLKPSSTKCSQTNLTPENNHLNASGYYKQQYVLGTPKSFNITFLNESAGGCPKNICIPLVPRFCEDNWKNCKVFTLNNTYEPICNLSLFSYQNSCKNLVQKVRYDFHHNGTNGIMEAFVNILLTNRTFDLREENLFFQEFKVNFLWVNKTRANYSGQLSGNPGYAIGKPILIATLFLNESFVNDTKANATNMIVNKIIVNKVVLRNSSKFVENFLVLPGIQNSACVISDDGYTLIEYGYNMVAKCNLIVVVPQEQSANSTCQVIQQTIFKYWSIKINHTKTLVGNFGNANANTMSDWSEVIYETAPEVVLNQTVGNFSANNATVTCHNLVTQIKLSVFHSRVVYEDLINQEKITRSTVAFGEPVSVRLKINEKQVFISIPLRGEVMFYDVTKEIVKKFADPPTFEVKLPYDFFYPFIKVGSCGSTIYMHLSMLSFMAIAMIMVHWYF